MTPSHPRICQSLLSSGERHRRLRPFLRPLPIEPADAPKVQPSTRSLFPLSPLSSVRTFNTRATDRPPLLLRNPMMRIALFTGVPNGSLLNTPSPKTGTQQSPLSPEIIWYKMLPLDVYRPSPDFDPVIRVSTPLFDILLQAVHRSYLGHLTPL